MLRLLIVRHKLLDLNEFTGFADILIKLIEKFSVYYAQGSADSERQSML